MLFLLTSTAIIKGGSVEWFYRKGEVLPVRKLKYGIVGLKTSKIEHELESYESNGAGGWMTE